MATFNESINESASPATEENFHHISWLEKIIGRPNDLDTNFPLSGGDSGHVRIIRYKQTEPANTGQTNSQGNTVLPQDEKTGEHHHRSWFARMFDSIPDIDTNFPLSGGQPSHN